MSVKYFFSCDSFDGLAIKSRNSITSVVEYYIFLSDSNSFSSRLLSSTFFFFTGNFIIINRFIAINCPLARSCYVPCRSRVHVFSPVRQISDRGVNSARANLFLSPRAQKCILTTSRTRRLYIPER